jgi:ribulose-5-phosphate 4-epimerase/fuculose-1-phosphate aldolase
VYESYGGAAIAAEEGKHIAEALGPKNKSIILQNHGILSCGGSVGEAAAYYIALERACHAQLLAEAAAANGINKIVIDAKEAAMNKNHHTSGFMYMQFVPEYELQMKLDKGDFLE